VVLFEVKINQFWTSGKLKGVNVPFFGMNSSHDFEKTHVDLLSDAQFSTEISNSCEDIHQYCN
jgi:hypothetical protein